MADSTPPQGAGAPTRRALLRTTTLGIAGALAGCFDLDTDELCGTDPPPTDGPGAIGSAAGTLSVSPDAAWPMPGYDAARTGHNPAATLPDDPAIRWRFRTREPPEREGRRPQRPVVDGRTVYLVNAHRELVAVDARDGSLRWRLSDPRLRTDDPPAVGAGLVFLGGRAGLFAVDSAGEMRWRYAPDDVPTNPTPTTVTPPPTPTNGSPPAGEVPRQTGFGPPLVADGTVYAGSSVGIHAVDAATGEERWTSTAGDLEAVAGDRVLASDGQLVALRAADGTEWWRAPETPYGAVAARDGAVYAGELKRLHRLDGATGEKEWTYEGETESFASPAVGPDRVYAPSSVSEGGDGGNLYALDRSTGDPAWCEYLGFTAVRPPAVADGTVHAPTDRGFLGALGAADGSLSWSFYREYGFPESVAAVDGGVILGGQGDVWGIG